LIFNSITACCCTEYENGHGYMVTEYLAKCGCHWKVDQWGNVRTVQVCWKCMQTDPAADQLLFADLTPEPAAAGSKAKPRN